MMRATLTTATLMTTTFAALVLVLHALPYRPHGAFTFFAASEGCPSPCVMGVRPGVMRANAAVSLLEDRGWVGHVGAASFENNVEFFTWYGQHPDIMDDVQWARLGVENDQVRTLVVPTRLRLGDLLAYYGTVETWTVNGSEIYGGFYRHGFVARLPIRARPFGRIDRLFWSPVTLYIRWVGE
jgi:hypothetical protein